MDADAVDLAAGGLIVFVASFLGGVSGFGYSLTATPLLLVLGFPLPFVVTANLALAFITRMPVVVRFHRHVWRRRASLMVLGSIPGLWLGTQLLTEVDEATIKVIAGMVAMLAATLLARSLSAPPPPRIPGAAFVAGVAGGFLGAATSLNGIAPVLLLARDKAPPRTFLADLAVYFVVSNAIGLTILALEGALREDALWPAFVLWLPGSVAGNWLGTTVGPRLPEAGFRWLVLAVVFVAGGVTALSA
jgi:uncharacterized membrane protein YfcA